jgi:hypothetical protein
MRSIGTQARAAAVRAISATFLFAALAYAAQAQPGVAITTAQFDNFRSGANLNEKTLNTSNVNVSGFGKLYSFTVQGYVYAQPLYVPNLPISTGKKRNVLYVATMHNMVYAFDADDPAQPPFFQINLGPPVPAGEAGACPNWSTTGSEIGVLSTPVIDTGSGTLYLVSATPNAAGGGYIHRLFALDLVTGQNKPGSPVVIDAKAAGTAPDAVGGQVTLNQTTEIQRPGLLLANGSVYAAFGSCGDDIEPYHGWVIGYNASTLAQTVAFNASPNGHAAGIWQSGRGLTADGSGAIYAFTGNGDASAADYGDTVLKLTASGAVADWFTPSNAADLDYYDLDLSSSGPVFLPDANLVVGGGKEGVLYVLNPSALGQSGAPLQQFAATAACGQYSYNGCHRLTSVAYANGTLYVWGEGDVARAYKLSNGAFAPASTGNIYAGFPGGSLALSSQSGQRGSNILWAVTPDSVLHAFDATDLTVELWNSNQNAARDGLGTFAKYGQPVITGGKVFVPTFGNAVIAYGLIAGPGRK